MLELVLLFKVIESKAIELFGSPDAQKRKAISLIREAKNNGAQSIEIELDQDAAIEIQANLSLLIGIPLDTKARVGAKGRMKIKVIFK